VTPEARERAEVILGYTFNNPDLLKESLTHASIATNRLASNERMEFLGDAVLDLIICEALYKKFPQHLEGDLTKIKSAVVSRRTCAECRWRRARRPADHRQGHQLARGHAQLLAAAVYESIVAAIYLDGGFDVVKDYVLRTMTPKMERSPPTRISRTTRPSPAARAEDARRDADLRAARREGPGPQQVLRGLRDGRRPRFTSAWGPNKKMAEQKAGAAGAGRAGRVRSEGSRRSDRADRRRDAGFVAGIAVPRIDARVENPVLRIRRKL
jgi:ribonuclease-3